MPAFLLKLAHNAERSRNRNDDAAKQWKNYDLHSCGRRGTGNANNLRSVPSGIVAIGYTAAVRIGNRS